MTSLNAKGSVLALLPLRNFQASGTTRDLVDPTHFYHNPQKMIWTFNTRAPPPFQRSETYKHMAVKDRRTSYIRYFHPCSSQSSTEQGTYGELSKSEANSIKQDLSIDFLTVEFILAPKS